MKFVKSFFDIFRRSREGHETLGDFTPPPPPKDKYLIYANETTRKFEVHHILSDRTKFVLLKPVKKTKKVPVYEFLYVNRYSVDSYPDYKLVECDTIEAAEACLNAYLAQEKEREEWVKNNPSKVIEVES